MKARIILTVLMIVGLASGFAQAESIHTVKMDVVRYGMGLSNFGPHVYVAPSDLIIPQTADKAGTIDMVSYGDSTMTTIVAGKDLTVINYEFRGINMDRQHDKFFDMISFHSAGIVRTDCGKTDCLIYATYEDNSGDLFVVEFSKPDRIRDWSHLMGTDLYAEDLNRATDNPGDREWKFLYGTGKFKGITGGGKATVVAMVAKASTDTYQSLAKKPETQSSEAIPSYVKLTGTYALK